MNTLNNPSGRRRFIGSLAAAGLGAALQISPKQLFAGGSAPRCIDVHCHIAPPEWIRRLGPDGVVLPAMAKWSVARQLEDMDRGHVEKAINSITTPGLWVQDAASARSLARACNEYAAKLRSERPGRFGIFAVLPLPDIDGSLIELAYSLDVLRADGVCLFTNYGGKWLGDPAFDEVFAELNRRKSLVFTHPVAANCCRNLLPGISDASIELGTDTARAITRFVFSGSAARYPDLRMIFSHAGGSMPILIDRIEYWARTPPNPQIVPMGFRAPVRNFYYDIALSANSLVLTALKSIVPVSHILFGTDSPYRTSIAHVTGLENSGVFSASEIQLIERGNALALGIAA